MTTWTIDPATLARAITLAGTTVAKGHVVLPVTAGVRLTATPPDRLTVETTDTERAVRVTVPLAAPVTTEARVILPFEALKLFLRTLDTDAGPLAVVVDDAGTVWTAGRARLKLSRLAADDNWPESPVPSDAALMVDDVSAKALLGALASVRSAQAADHGSPALQGVHLATAGAEGLHVYGCDGVRLARAILPLVYAGPPWAVTLSAASVAALPTLLDGLDTVTLTIDPGRAVIVETPGLTARLAVLQSEYPRVTALLTPRPTTAPILTIEAAAWSGALDRVRIVDHAVTIAVADDFLTLRTMTSESHAEDAVPATVTQGDALPSVIVNGQLLDDLLTACPSATLEAWWAGGTGKDAAVYLAAADGDWRAVVMPLRG